MKINDLIKNLQAIKKKHGDIDVWHSETSFHDLFYSGISFQMKKGVSPSKPRSLRNVLVIKHCHPESEPSVVIK